MAQIHPSSIVHPEAVLADDVIVGPFCLVGPKVQIGAGTHLRSHVCVEGRTTIGSGNVIYAGASIGCDPQDKKYAGEDTALVVGDNNVIRENCTLSIGTVQDEGITRVGSDNLFMANVHVAHDCRVGDHTIIANNVALAGHVTVEDWAIIGGQTGVHQFVRIGAHSMVGGASAALRDVPPYVICSGNRLSLMGLILWVFVALAIRAIRCEAFIRLIVCSIAKVSWSRKPWKRLRPWKLSSLKPSPSLNTSSTSWAIAPAV